MRMKAKKNADILKKRAIALATPPNTAENETKVEFVEFKLDDEHYGIDIKYVKEVCLYKDLTPLPGHAAFILGLINVRGQIYSMVDLKNIYGILGNASIKYNQGILLSNNKILLGISASVIVGVMKINGSAIQPPSTTFNGKEIDYIEGVTNDRVLIINVNKIYAEHEQITTENSS